MSFFKKVERLVDRIPEGIHRTGDTVKGILNPNRRHDEPHEKEQDRVLAEIRSNHRFDSFAGERSQNFVKWHIDGHDYMYALSEMLDSAREAIFILDWWLTPELYLRRPPAYNYEWRLDRLLRRKAEQGVKIFVIVYKEVTQTMSMSSHHTKETLEALHPNISCMRHPDHIGSKDDVQFWSHHEKVVVVDNHRACIGGLDLCFGRWDTHTHPLADVHPTEFARTLFPGQDYNNARVLDFQQVDNFVNNALSVLETARMPWHDVHMTLTGDVVLDIVQHFVERWNEIKQRKYRSDNDRYPVLALPHNVEVAPNEPVARHPHREAWHEMGHRFKERFHLSDDGDGDEDDPNIYPRAPTGSCTVQVVRSVCDWSHGVLTEHSIQNAYCQMIMEANHYIYIENQFFISTTQSEGPVKNQIAKALVDRIIRAARNHEKFKVVVFIPELPGFSGNIKDESALKIIMAAQYRTINRGGHSIYEEIRNAGFEPLDYIRFYHLRAYDRINAPYPSFISKMEENSGVKFHEAQVALARQWIGEAFDGVKTQKEVKIKVPTATGEGITDTKAKEEAVKFPATEEEAKDIVHRFERGAESIRGDDDVADTVVQHMLEDRTNLLQEKWLGSEDEERTAFVTELLYIHSKVMIVDDRRVIMGSANINDRSQKGDGDSEIALVVEDTDMLETTMNGNKYMAGKFAASLRRKLYREHLGLIRPQTCQDQNEEVKSFMRPAPIPNEEETYQEEDALVADPLADATERLLTETAKSNRDIFTEIFQPVPSNLVRNWRSYDNYVPKVKAGHVVPDISLERVKQRLSLVRGAVVECPLDFLIEEKEFVENRDWTGINPTLPIYI